MRSLAERTVPHRSPHKCRDASALIKFVNHYLIFCGTALPPSILDSLHVGQPDASGNHQGTRAAIICGRMQKMPLETIARYRSYAADCVEIANNVSAVAVKLELLAMARVWLTLANESQAGSGRSRNKATRALPPKKWRLIICNWTVSPPVEFCSECNSKGEAIERAYNLPPQCIAVRIEGPHGERIDSKVLER